MPIRLVILTHQSVPSMMNLVGSTDSSISKELFRICPPSLKDTKSSFSPYSEQGDIFSARISSVNLHSPRNLFFILWGAKHPLIKSGKYQYSEFSSGFPGIFWTFGFWPNLQSLLMVFGVCFDLSH